MFEQAEKQLNDIRSYCVNYLSTVLEAQPGQELQLSTDGLYLRFQEIGGFPTFLKKLNDDDGSTLEQSIALRIPDDYLSYQVVELATDDLVTLASTVRSVLADKSA